ncbi:mannose-1-phosphate guanylyltransferase [Halobium salinum]|uniref:Mannose-1-phosphate guanylyltransferase n=1 Tax=Halobium salinum TaxID=1364940 RepID=A0ABD5P820_9EURY|nr:sugar phosphate nucleotidyltransferase [Halobium salinum]
MNDTLDRPVVALVLAGGTGTRLYPASRSHRPKQFLSLGDADDRSLLSRTVARADFADEVVVSTRRAFADEIENHAPDAEVLVEPAAKDTGPALSYATHRIAERYAEDGDDGADPVVVVLPADHHVADRPETDDAGAGGVENGRFSEAMLTGARVAADTGALVAFGVEPTRPDPGYGYIEPGDDREGYHDLAAFHEKPDPETAAEYVDAGHLWNAGIFAWTAESFLEAARDSPLRSLVHALDWGDTERGFDEVEEVSVDYAVMERAENAAVVPVSFRWDDLGSWDALERVLGDDEAGNAVLGEGLTVDAADNVVASDDTHVSLVGVEGLCVVAWDDRVLVVPKDEAQRVREVVAALKEGGRF